MSFAIVCTVGINITLYMVQETLRKSDLKEIIEERSAVLCSYYLQIDIVPCEDKGRLIKLPRKLQDSWTPPEVCIGSNHYCW